MRDKYVEERFQRYFEFGAHADGRVDVTTANEDVVVAVSKEDMEKLVKDRDKIVDALCEMARAFDKAAPEEFSKFWYGA